MADKKKLPSRRIKNDYDIKIIEKLYNETGNFVATAKKMGLPLSSLIQHMRRYYQVKFVRKRGVKMQPRKKSGEVL